MNKEFTHKNYHNIVDTFVESLKHRKHHLWEISENYNDGECTLELIHDEMERIDKVLKLYKNNKI